MPLNIPEASASSEEALTSSEDFMALCHRITGQSEEQFNSFKNSASSFSEMLSESIKSAGGVTHEHWSNAVLACVIAAEAAEQWSEDLEWYENQSEILRTQAQHDATHLSSTPQEGQELSPRASFIQSLQVMADENWEELEERAEDCSKTIQDGTDPENVADLVKNGSLGWLPYNLVGEVMPTPLGEREGGELGEEIAEMLESGEIDSEAYAALMANMAALTSRAQEMQNRGEDLSDDEIDYLEALYEALEELETEPTEPGSDGVISIPNLIENSIEDGSEKSNLLEGLGNGLLILSNEQIGGGEERLPESVRNAAMAPALRGEDPEGMYLVEDYSEDLLSLEEFLGKTPNDLEGGRQFSQNITLSTGSLLNGMYSDEFINVGEEALESLLDVSTRSDEANHGIFTRQYENENIEDEQIDNLITDVLDNFLMHGDSFEPPLPGSDPDDEDFEPHVREPGGFTALFDWLSDQESNSDPETRSLTTESMAALIDFMSEPDRHESLRIEHGSDQGISRDAADSLADAFEAHMFSFASDAGLDGGELEEDFSYSSEGDIFLSSPQDRLLFLEILMSDESAAVDVHTSTAQFSHAATVESIETGSFREVDDAGRLVGLVEVALENEAFYRDIEGDDLVKNRERIWDVASDMILGSVGEAVPSRFSPAFDAVGNFTSDRLKDSLIESIPPSDLYSINSDGEFNYNKIKENMHLHMLENMFEDYNDNPEESANPMDSMPGSEEEIENSAERLNRLGVVSEGEDGKVNFDIDRAREILLGEHENEDGEEGDVATMDSSDLRDDLADLTHDTNMSWLNDIERNGGQHQATFLEEHRTGRENIHDALGNEDKEELQRRDDDLEEEDEEDDD